MIIKKSICGINKGNEQLKIKLFKIIDQRTKNVHIHGVSSLRPKRNPTPISNVCEEEPIRTQRITANAF